MELTNTEKNLVFLDTETTGKDENDIIIQVAYKTRGVESCELFKPDVPIQIEAQATHHITPKMVADKPLFKDSEMYATLREMFADKNNILVAHNAKFDVEMLRRAGIEVNKKQVICTLKMARHLDPDGKIKSYSLQYLRYLLGLEVAEATAHDALGDIRVLEALFERLYKKVVETYDIPFPIDDDYIDHMVSVSSQPSLIKIFVFGKHKDKKVADVAKTDLDYLRWLLAQKSNDSMPDEDWIYTLNYYLYGREKNKSTG